MRVVLELDKESGTWFVTSFESDLPLVEYFGLSLTEALQVAGNLCNEFLAV